MIASCGFLVEELRQCSNEEGVTMADSVKTLRVDLRTRVRSLGVKEKARRKKCKVRFSLISKNKAFQKHYMKVGVRKLFRAWMVPAKTWREHAVEMAPAERLKLNSPYSWKPLSLKWKKSLPRLGQKGRGLANGTQNKKKLG